MSHMQRGAFDKNQTYILKKKTSVQLNMCIININNILFLSGNLGSLRLYKKYTLAQVLIWQMVWHGPKGMDTLGIS